MEGRLLSLVQTSLGAASKSEGLQANDVESLHLSDVFVVRSTKILSFMQDIISSTSGTRQSSSEIKCDDKINFYNCNLCISHLPRSVLLFAQPQYSTTVSQAWGTLQRLSNTSREREMAPQFNEDQIAEFQVCLRHFKSKICWLIDEE